MKRRQDRSRYILQGMRQRTVDDAVSLPWYLRSPRLLIVGWVIILLIALLVIRLYQLQFREGGSWRVRAEQQQTRLENISPSRGVMYDRKEEILVRNIPAYNVTITPGLLPEDEEREREVLMRLSTLIDIPYSSEQGFDVIPYQDELNIAGRSLFAPYGEAPPPGLLEMVDAVRYLTPYAAIVVEENVDREIALLIAQEAGLTMPGIAVETVSQRNYVYGELLSQVLGFLGPIPEGEADEYEAKGYVVDDDRIGYAGIEAQLENELRGTAGRRVVVKDVQGQVLEILSETPASAGDNVFLTIDLKLQAVAEGALKVALDEVGSRRGALVALDPRDGQILALVSLPTFDNNLFSGDIDPDAYESLLEDPHYPFINHAIADSVPPGSTFKIIPASGALQEGVINRYTTTNCTGQMLLPNKFVPDDPTLAQPFYCWIQLQNGGGHGPLNVVDALAQSCDVFFYQVGGGYEETNFEGLGVDRLAHYASMFGLGEPTGIDIPGEAAGLVPSPQWKRLQYAETWTTGDTYNMSIGQGYVLATPLQMANALAAVANGGTLYQPQLLHHIADAEGKVIQDYTPVVNSTLEIDAAVWDVVHEGLDLAVSETGTGNKALLEDELVEINIAGKTGTAEYCDDIAYEAGRCDVAEYETLPTHAWFMAYAPVEAPEIVIVAWVYDGGEGSQVAAPVVKDVMDYYFRDQLGLLDIQEAVEEIETADTSEP